MARGYTRERVFAERGEDCEGGECETTELGAVVLEGVLGRCIERMRSGSSSKNIDERIVVGEDDGEEGRRNR